MLGSNIMIALRLAGLLVMLAAFRLGAAEAIQSLAGFTDVGVVFDGGAGFAFKPATNLYVNALGYLFLTNLSALDSAVVELQDSRGDVRASVTLTNSSPQAGDWNYQAIPAFFVPANTTNYVVAYDPVEYAASHTKSWSGAHVEAVSPGTTWFEPAPELVYLGPTVGTDIVASPSYYYIGANFQFIGVPSPPALEIVLTLTNTVVLTWPTQAVSFHLQATTSLRSWPITNLADQPIVADTNNVLVLPCSQPSTFYRLIQ
jgi:hypothetical protein